MAAVERERHRLAFERYVALGRGRSLPRLAAELGASESAVKAWSRAFRWRERLEARTREIAEALARDSTEAEREELQADRRMVHLAMVRIAKALVEGHVKPTIADMDRVIRLRRDLDEGQRGSEDRVFVVRRDTYVGGEDDDGSDDEGLCAEVETDGDR